MSRPKSNSQSNVANVSAENEISVAKISVAERRRLPSIEPIAVISASIQVSVPAWRSVPCGSRIVPKR